MRRRDTIAEGIKETRKKSRAARFASRHVINFAFGSSAAVSSIGYSQISTVFPNGRRAGRSFINSLLPSLHLIISSAFGNCQPLLFSFIVCRSFQSVYGLSSVQPKQSVLFHSVVK